MHLKSEYLKIPSWIKTIYVHSIVNQLNSFFQKHGRFQNNLKISTGTILAANITTLADWSTVRINKMAWDNYRPAISFFCDI